MFVYYRNTKDRCKFETEADAIQKMDDEKEMIEYDDFMQEVDCVDVVNNLGYIGDELFADWAVSYYKSTFDGITCLIMDHGECEFIFLPEEDVKRLLKERASSMSAAEWQRHTGYGRKGIDPRA